MSLLFPLAAPFSPFLSGASCPLLLAQSTDASGPSGRVVWAIVALVGLGVILLLTVLLLVLIGGSRRARLESEAARRKRIVTVGENAWEEAGRRARLADDDEAGDEDV
jgi:hypothetical protein